ncbi:hypothetical protein C7387_0571 [Yokenella regensburgei]|uniref:IS110 family transposase n=1 Tax=Yokenella regensburgei TaxID=158877 RepID=A0ABX9S2Q9_9ENTR|nr:hypothetical protein C7387_0571 [Yokenella regensburgei]VFS24620.1 Uncharacterised protein [Yokenella regensburgei]
MTIATIGIDLAKNVFSVHGVDHNGKSVLVKSRVTRAALPGLIADLPVLSPRYEISEVVFFGRLCGLCSTVTCSYSNLLQCGGFNYG